MTNEVEAQDSVEKAIKYWEGLEDQDLASRINELGEEWGRLAVLHDRALLILKRRLEQRGAKELHHPQLEVKLETPSPRYDYGKLRRLAELIDPGILLEGYSPEHREVQEVVVPEKWNATKFKTWGNKYGREVQEVIDGARMEGGPTRLRITKKKEKTQ